MKKTLVALATLSAIGSAFADIDIAGGIKMYGVLDQAAMRQSWLSSTDATVANAAKNLSSSQSGLFAASSTSRLGFRGNRDLGNDTKALFQIEMEIAAQNNSDQDTGYKTRGLMPPKNRGTFVGIENKNNGSLRLGTQETTAYETFAMDVNGRVEYKPQVWRYTTSNSTQDRSGHSLKFTTAEYAGFTGSVMYAPKQQADAAKDANAKNTPQFSSMGLKYVNGQAQVAYVRDREVDRSSATAGAYRMPGDQYEGLRNGPEGTESKYAAGSAASALTRNILGASYDFGAAKLVYIYTDASVPGDTTKGGKLTTSTFGVRVPLDQFAFAASYGNGSYATTDNTINGNVTDTTLGAYYNFDKSTTAYFLYSNSTHTYKTNPAGYTRATAVGLKYVF